jgi:hypothetical protein
MAGGDCMRNEFFNRINTAQPLLQGRGLKSARIMFVHIYMFFQFVRRTFFYFHFLLKYADKNITGAGIKDLQIIQV